jgi:hypothetical protein
VDVIDVVEPHETEHLADAGDGVPPIQGVGVMMFGGVDEGEFHVAKPSIIVAAAWPIDFNPFVHRWIGKALSTPVTGGFSGHLLATGRQGIRAVGLLPVGQPRGPVVCPRHPASKPVAGRPPLGRIDRGVWEHAATAQDGKLWRGDRGVFGLPTMDRLHVQGMAADERDAFVSPQVGQPVPGEQAFDRDDETLSLGRHDFQQGLRGCLHMTVHENLAALVEDADVQGTGMQVDAAGTLVRGVVNSL